MQFNDLLRYIFEAGVAGAGGAGFPTYLKLSVGIDTVIINAAECEPLLKVDKHVVSKHWKELMAALEQIVEAIGAKRGIVALKGKNLKYIENVQRYMDNSTSRLSVMEIKDIYPIGDEVVLTYEVTGRVVPEASLPKDVGVLVLNAETLYNINNSFSLAPVTKKYVTIAGSVPKPTTFFVPIGTSVAMLLNSCGLNNFDGLAFINGGPLMGGFCNPETEVVTKTTKGIIVLPENHSHVQKKKIKSNVALKRASAACCQCRMCTDMCPRYLLGHTLEVHKTIRNVANNISSDTVPYYKAQLCCGCGICDYIACTQDICPRAVCGEVKGQMIKNNLRYKGSLSPAIPRSEREFRMVPSSRILQRCGLFDYDVEAPLYDKEIIPERVFIKLKQHVGKPAVPVVNNGDAVYEGQLLAKIEMNEVGTNIHASIDGIVTEVTQEGIWVSRN